MKKKISKKKMNKKNLKKIKIKKVKVKAKKIVVKIKVKRKVSKKSKKRAIKRLPPSYSSKDIVLGPINVRPYHPKKNEEYMNKKQLTHFEEILLQWKNQLMEDVDRTKHHLQNEAANYPDPVDRASQEEEFNFELRARDRERKLLKKIEETLIRINKNDYGYCDDCGAEIGVRRLEARPTATQCVECKTISEIKEKQIGEVGVE